MQLRAVQPKPGRLGGILLGKSYIENLLVSPSCGGKNIANPFQLFLFEIQYTFDSRTL